MIQSNKPALLSTAPPHDHLVGFYDEESFLVESVADFLGPAFDTSHDAVAVSIATPEHHDGIITALTARGYDTSDRYVQLDARTILTAILQDGIPDAERFDGVVGDLVQGHTDRGRTVYAFGEMVTLLWQDDAVTEALHLEKLWDVLVASTPFALYCTYPTSAFGRDLDTDAFRAVCDAHSRVLPSEAFSRLTDPDEQRRSVAILQQEVVAAANERTQMRQKQDELASRLDRVLEAERVRERFAAMVVHDIRNPTSVISTLLELLRQTWSDLDPEQVEEYLATAGRSATQIERLVDDLLVMSRLDSGRFTYDLGPVDLRALATEQAREMQDLTGRTIEVSGPTDLPDAFADDGRQRQILGNLLANATRFSDPATPVTMHLEARADQIVVRVQDHGCGIAADDLPKLFQPFSKLAEDAGRRGGTGLGLYITRALVEGQGGTIHVTSEPEVGTTFTYTVPCAPAG